MTVLVHPTAVNARDIVAIQRTTGLRAIVSGRVVHLVQQDGKHPAMGRTKKTSFFGNWPTGPYNGGGAAA